MLLLILLYKDVMTKLSNRKFSPLFCTILIILRVLVRKPSRRLSAAVSYTHLRAHETLCCKRNGCITARSTRLDIEINLSPVFVRFDFGMASCI